jgi:NAD(P)-dependent dehydrogenase (short-subunit alcohol dehydrogenase family)
MRTRRAERGSGAIAQMSSLGGRLSFPGVGAYSATKVALEGRSEALVKEVEPFGIRVLIVEPGAFRTSFNTGGALLLSRRIPAYDEQIDAVRSTLADDDGKQPGDPARAAAAILIALQSDQPPLRPGPRKRRRRRDDRVHRRRESRAGGVGRRRPGDGVRHRVTNRFTLMW